MLTKAPELNRYSGGGLAWLVLLWLTPDKLWDVSEALWMTSETWRLKAVTEHLSQTEIDHISTNYRARALSKRCYEDFSALSWDDLQISRASMFISILIESYRCFNEALIALVHLHSAYICLLTLSDSVSTQISDSSKYSSYFKDCVETLDDIYIDVFVSEESAASFWDRWDRLSQNVLTVCIFDLQFSYVLAEWESSAHDA